MGIQWYPVGIVSCSRQLVVLPVDSAIMEAEYIKEISCLIFLIKQAYLNTLISWKNTYLSAKVKKNLETKIF